MTLTFANGTKKEAVLLSRVGDQMRVTMAGSEDAVQLTETSGVWVSEDCEVVKVEFAWQKKKVVPVVEEADCICSHELASRLIHLLWNGTDEKEAADKATCVMTAAMSEYAVSGSVN